MNLFAIGLIWTAYCFIHSYMISIRFTRLAKNLLKEYYAFYRIFYVISSIVLLIPVLYYSRLWSTPTIFHYSGAVNIIRYTLSAAALLIFIKAFFIDYDLLTFVGIRQMMHFRKNDTSEKGPISKTGLLGFVRHPMYFAVILFLWCNTFSISDMVVNAVLTTYIFIGTLLEEKKLILEFGEEYIQYQQEVPMLIPFTKIKNPSPHE